MRTACRQGQQWLAEGLAVPRLSVNVSVREMRSHDYVERVTAILAETGFPAERLEIEVTESIIQSVDHSLRLFTRLKALGVQIAIDDFGTGFSSLSLLRSLPIDRIKIDRAFVQALPDDKHSRELCRTIVQLASSLGMAVTAEGIETQPASPAPPPPLSLGRATTQAKKGAHDSLLLPHHGLPGRYLRRYPKV